MSISTLRKKYHDRLCDQIIRINTLEDVTYPNFSDSSSRASVNIGMSILNLLNRTIETGHQKEQTIGKTFEEITKDFLEDSFNLLSHIRPGYWIYTTRNTDISRYEQYEHLARLETKIKSDKDLSSVLGQDYIVKPDIVIARQPLIDDELNLIQDVVNQSEEVCNHTPLRLINLDNPNTLILHASISCKWSIRSDRSQNTRTEALNLIRNRKGKLPHICAVTAEPLPTRIATLALGTGDLDCVYHFALTELRQAVRNVKNEDQQDMLETMINGKRLRDISDLPLDIAI